MRVRLELGQGHGRGHGPQYARRFPRRQVGNAGDMTRLLIAVDETEDSLHAAQVAHQLFGDDAEYLAVSVADMRLDPSAVPWWDAGWGAAYPIAYGTVWPYRESPDGTGTLEQQAEDAASSVAAEAGLTDATTVGESGDPAEAILRSADEHDADIIVVGTHDRGWFARLFEPSVSTEVVKRSPRPVLVVR